MIKLIKRKPKQPVPNVYHTSDKCSLAVKIDGEVYEVQGSTLKDHGKPWKKDGLWKVEREAEITGEVKNGVFVAFDFQLLPMVENTLPKLEAVDTDKI